MRDAGDFGSGSGGSTPPPSRPDWTGVGLAAVLAVFIVAMTIVLRTT